VFAPDNFIWRWLIFVCKCLILDSIEKEKNTLAYLSEHSLRKKQSFETKNYLNQKLARLENITNDYDTYETH
jgi:hypothetical protein